MFWSKKKDLEIEYLKNKLKDYRKICDDQLDNIYYLLKLKQINNDAIQDLKKELQASKDHQTFSQEEIKRMIILCHPDKHNGKQMAVDITAKLVKMRN